MALLPLAVVAESLRRLPVGLLGPTSQNRALLQGPVPRGGHDFGGAWGSMHTSPRAVHTSSDSARGDAEDGLPSLGAGQVPRPSPDS